MKAQLLLWLALAAFPVQAKMEHERFVYRDWQIISKEVIVLPQPPYHPKIISLDDIGSRLVCQTSSGRLFDEGIVTLPFIVRATEKQMAIFCLGGRAQDVNER
jgi:hypothetical protein